MTDRSQYQVLDEGERFINFITDDWYTDDNKMAYVASVGSNLYVFVDFDAGNGSQHVVRTVEGPPGLKPIVVKSFGLKEVRAALDFMVNLAATEIEQEMAAT